MSWIPTSPEDKTVAGPTVVKAMNRFKVTSIHIDAVTNGLQIGYAEGYDDAGTFVAANHFNIELAGDEEELITVMTAMADNTKSLRDNIRDSAYTLLAALGKLPDGASA